VPSTKGFIEIQRQMAKPKSQSDTVKLKLSKEIFEELRRLAENNVRSTEYILSHLDFSKYKNPEAKKASVVKTLEFWKKLLEELNKAV